MEWKSIRASWIPLGPRSSGIGRRVRKLDLQRVGKNLTDAALWSTQCVTISEHVVRADDQKGVPAGATFDAASDRTFRPAGLQQGAYYPMALPEATSGYDNGYQSGAPCGCVNLDCASPPTTCASMQSSVIGARDRGGIVLAISMTWSAETGSNSEADVLTDEQLSHHASINPLRTAISASSA